MKISIIVLAIILMKLFGTVHNARLEKLSMEVTEKGKKFNETIYVDNNDNYEIFKVPPHLNTSELILINDFKRGYSIYKVKDDATCYIVPLDPKTEKPMKLKKSVKEVHSVFPSSSFTVNHASLMKGEAFDLKSSMGKVAGRFCKGYEVVHAQFRKGDIDLHKLAQEEQQKLTSIDKNAKRDVFEFYHACSTNFTPTIQKCLRDKRELSANCVSRRFTCVYMIECYYRGSVLVGCKSTHNFVTYVCCNYSCP